MSYEQHCNDFALYGDPEREHWDHEDFARYDYINEAYGDSGDGMQDWMDSLDLEEYEEIDENGVSFDVVAQAADEDDDGWDDVPF